MPANCPWPEPEWLAGLPDVDRKKAYTRFLLGMASLYAGKSGKISGLARSLDMNIQTVHSSIERGAVSPEMAIAIETLLGRKLFPRELFRPDLFTIPAE